MNEHIRVVNPNRFIAGSLLLSLSLALLLSACSQSSDTSPGSTASPGASTTVGPTTTEVELEVESPAEPLPVDSVDVGTTSLDYTQYKIAVTSEANKDPFGQDIFVLNPDGTEWIDITNSPGADADPAWSPDGKKIAFLSLRSGNGEIWIMDADGSNPYNLTNDRSRMDLEPEWSPDGKKVVYISNSGSGGTAEIFVIDADGKNKKQLTANTYDDAYPVFSPNGKMIVFHSDNGEVPIGVCNDPKRGTVTKYVNEIYLMDIDGNNVVQLTDFGMNTGGISWSPDGTQLVYRSSEGCETSQIYTIDIGALMDMDLSILKDKTPKELEGMEGLESLRITQLTDNFGPDTNPSFSPDGTKIVWQSIRDGIPGGNELYIMNSNDGGNVTRITFTNALEKDPDWMR